MKNTLARYKYSRFEVANLQESIKNLEDFNSKLVKLSQTCHEMREKGSKIDFMSEVVQILIGERYEALFAILALKSDIEFKISMLPVPERLVITEYYLNGLSWSEVAEKLFISPSWCYKLHNRALKLLSV